MTAILTGALPWPEQPGRVIIGVFSDAMLFCNLAAASIRLITLRYSTAAARYVGGTMTRLDAFVTVMSELSWLPKPEIEAIARASMPADSPLADVELTPDEAEQLLTALRAERLQTQKRPLGPADVKP